MKTNKRDVIWAYLSRTFSLGVNIILLPIIMKYLSDQELGLWYVFASISQVVNLFDFGFNATIARHMTYAWSGANELTKTSVSELVSDGPNIPLMNIVIQTCKRLYLIISICALLTMFTVGSAYINSVVDGAMTFSVFSSWIIYAVAVFLNLFFSYWTSMLLGIGAVAEKNKMGVYSKLLQIVLAIILLMLNLGLLGFVIAYAISGVALRILGKIYFRRNTQNYVFDKKVKGYEIKRCFEMMWGTAWRDGLVMIAQYLSTQANTLICAYYIDLGSTSTYGIITQIVSVIASISTAYYSAFQPKYSSVCLQKDISEQRKIVCKSDFVYKLIFISGMIAFIIIGIPILRILRPNMEIDIPLIILVSIFYYLFNQHSMFSSMIAASNRIPYCKSYLISALGSFGLSLVFTKYLEWGVMGLVIAQIIVNLLYNNWKWPIFLCKELQIKYRDIYIKGILVMKDIKNKL